MVHRGLKIATYLFAALLALAALTLLAAYGWSERKMRRVVKIDVVPVVFANDGKSILHGKYLYLSRGCGECHGVNGGGRVVIDSGGLYVKAPNIATGRDGVVGGYNETDWVRVIRHGVKRNGRPVLAMPSEDYNRLTDTDLAAVVAYVRHLAPAKGGEAVIRFPLTVRVLYAFGLVKDAAEKIDHSQSPAAPPAAGSAIDQGAYVANTCIGCHGPSLSGGRIPGTPPDWPAATNLTPGVGSIMPRYDDARKFAAMLRTGTRPDGSAINKVMPFGSLKYLTDADIDALYQYLKTVPARTVGER